MPERIRFLREAGEVLRLATYGFQDPTYTLGRQAFNVVNLILLLHPRPSLDLIKAAAWRTATERMTGEISAATREDLGTVLQAADRRILEHFKLDTDLTDLDVTWLIGCQKLELYFWAGEQIVRGNTRCAYLLQQLQGWFSGNAVPRQVARVLELHNPHARCMDSVPRRKGPTGE